MINDRYGGGHRAAEALLPRDNLGLSVGGFIGGTRRFFQPRRTAFYVYLLLLGLGLGRLVWGLLTQATPAVLLGGILWLVWLLIAYGLVSRADLYYSVPVSVRTAAILWGVACMSVSGPLVWLLGHALPIAENWRPAVDAPLAQETFKLLGVVVLAFMVPTVFSRPLGALMCGMLAGLGFTFIENWFQGNAPARGEPPAMAVLTNGILAGPWAHSLSTGIAALGIWYFITRTGVKRATGAVGFFALAILLHGLHNTLSAMGTLPLKVAVPVASLVALLFLVWFARRADRRWFLKLAAFDVPGISRGEMAALAGRRARRKALAAARTRRVYRAAATVRQIQRVELDYINSFDDLNHSTAVMPFRIRPEQRAFRLA